MSSSQPYLSNVRQWVKDTITPHIPTNWEVVPFLSDTLEKLHPVVYITFRLIDHGEGTGEVLPPGQARCEMVLEITPPETDTRKSEDAADDGVVELVAALHHRHIAWARAEKIRTDAGPIVWEVTLSVLCRITPPEDPEPEPEPEPDEPA